MFRKLVARNSRRDRTDHRLFFLSMVISVIAFYIILSLSHQDVMLFLKKMESDAVKRLLSIVPVFYAASLFLIFFLVYFASRLRLSRRAHEFGVYLTLGMKRGKLFRLLLLEDWRNDLYALAVGLPMAILISEIVSLVTAKAVGLGIVGHRFSLSPAAIGWTVFGFLLVKTVAISVLGGRIAKREIGELLAFSPSGAKRRFPMIFHIVAFAAGLLLLVYAYRTGISGRAWQGVRWMGVTVFCGISGTVLLFFGFRPILGLLATRSRDRKLATYHFRQIEELVIRRSTLLAVCSLLIFSAICLFAVGISVASEKRETAPHLFDYTFYDDESETDLSAERVRALLGGSEAASDFSKFIEVKVGHPREHDTLQMEELLERLRALPDSERKEDTFRNLEGMADAYLISLTGYNQVREIAGLPPIRLGEGEGALYVGSRFISDTNLLQEVMKDPVEIRFLGEKRRLLPEVHSLPIVTDRAITLSVALILEDEVFESYTAGRGWTYVNGMIDPERVEKKGLLGAILDAEERLEGTGLEHENYVQNIGRDLFYTVSASYLTTYLAVIFLVVANTIIGVLFLMGQRQSQRRTATLIRLGADYATLCRSAGREIAWYFGLPIAVALLNSFFGVRSLYEGILPVSLRGNVAHLSRMAGILILVLGGLEMWYIRSVKKHSDAYLRTLMEPTREE